MVKHEISRKWKRYGIMSWWFAYGCRLWTVLNPMQRSWRSWYMAGLLGDWFVQISTKLVFEKKGPIIFACVHISLIETLSAQSMKHEGNSNHWRKTQTSKYMKVLLNFPSWVLLVEHFVSTSGKIRVAAVETTWAPYCGPSLVCLFVPGGYCIYGWNSTWGIGEI